MSKTKLPDKWYIRGSKEFAAFIRKLELKYDFNSSILGEQLDRYYSSRDKAIKRSTWDYYHSVSKDRQKVTVSQLEDYYFPKTKNTKMSIFNKGDVVRVKKVSLTTVHSDKFKGKEGIVTGKTTYGGDIIEVNIDGKNRHIHNFDLIKVATSKAKKVIPDTFSITREQFKKIYDVACADWKIKITDLTKSLMNPFENACVINKSEVKKMYDASNAAQIKVLNAIFPDYSTDNNAFIRIFGNSIEKVSAEFFSDPYALQICHNSADIIKRPDLKGRAFYIDEEYQVKVHKTSSEGTIIEIIKK